MIILLAFLSCMGLKAQHKPIRIAFLADIHFQDLYGSFSDNEFKGIINPLTKKPVILRTMDAQLHSTRIFNENYFAFLQALDDIVKKGIKIVALPGDFSDDGQAYNIRGLSKILNYYHQNFGLHFYITTGNHDPVGPFLQDAGKDDFLGEDGSPMGIYSNTKIAGSAKSIITKDIAESGYLEILDRLKDFGFFPKKENLYWSTPFDTSSYKNYSFNTALQAAEYEKRLYNIANGFAVPDLSYVVEPTDGLWLLAIDGNTYIPKNKDANPNDPKNYSGAAVGYNNVLTHKQHLIQWVAKLAKQAKALGKTLIAFTHYPMVDFNDGASSEIKHLLGEKKWQMERLPSEEVAKTFAEAGLQVHFAGHMHINDTGIRQYGQNILVNIQVPSLAAYIPSYKILTVYSQDKMEVHTEVLDKVNRFDELFPLYRKEYKALKKSAEKPLWNKKILKSKSYHDYMAFHLKELVRLRMIPGDWPKDFYTKAKGLTGEKLLLMIKKREELEPMNINLKDYRNWKFEDLLLDLYKFQSADELAKKDIPQKRLLQYQVMEKLFSETKSSDKLVQSLKSVFKILSLLSNCDPADHFEIDLQQKILKRLE